MFFLQTVIHVQRAVSAAGLLHCRQLRSQALTNIDSAAWGFVQGQLIHVVSVGIKACNVKRKLAKSTGCRCELFEVGNALDADPQGPHQAVEPVTFADLRLRLSRFGR